MHHGIDYETLSNAIRRLLRNLNIVSCNDMRHLINIKKTKGVKIHFK